MARDPAIEVIEVDRVTILREKPFRELDLLLGRGSLGDFELPSHAAHVASVQAAQG